MEPKTKHRLLVSAIILLVIVNIGMMIFMFTGGKHHRHRKGKYDKHEMAHVLRRSLEFTPAQETSFGEMMKAHMIHIDTLSKQLEQTKIGLNNYLADPSNEEVALLLMQQGTIHQAMEAEIFRHLSEVYALCDEQQRPKFLHIMNKSFKKRHGH
jgi:hypothetical protein